jgi:hypothetical protein
MSATDDFARIPTAEWGPASNAVAVTPSDSTDLTYTTRALYVGGAGTVVVNMNSTGSSISFVAVAAGSILPIRVDRVRATGTTATSIVALF